MKKFRKLLSLMMAMVMVLSLSATAFAQDYNAGNGSIIITNATVGNTYVIYKIFDTDSAGVGNTASEAQKNFYESYGESNPFVFTENVAGSYNVTIKDGFSDAQVIAFLQSFVTVDEANGTVTVNDNFARVTTVYGPQEATSSATVEFKNIPYGYYLVTSSLGAVVTVDSTDPDVDIIDKNQDGGSSFTKTVDSDDEVVEIGEEFEYTLKFAATNYDGETQITEYTITDVLGTGLKLVYEEDDVTCGVGVTVGNQPVFPSVTYNEDSNTLIIKISWVDEDGNSMYSSPVDVTVTYTAVLTKDAAIQEDITNSATLTWTGNITGTSTTETVQTYALAIMKVDEEGGALEGATFTVTKDNTAVNVSFVGNDATTGADVYVVDPDSTSNVVVSPESGLIVIKGVDGDDYILTETAAPAGYNLLADSITVTPSSNGSTTITIYYNEDGNVVNEQTGKSYEFTAPVKVTAEVVVNKAGSLLPSTGGIGTTIFYAVGIVLMAGAVFFVVRRKRA